MLFCRHVQEVESLESGDNASNSRHYLEDRVLIGLSLKCQRRAGESPQPSGASTAFEDDLSFVPSTHLKQLTTSCNFSSQRSNAFWSLPAPTLRSTPAPPPTYIIKNKDHSLKQHPRRSNLKSYKFLDKFGTDRQIVNKSLRALDLQVTSLKSHFVD